MRAADMTAEDVYRMLYEVPQPARPFAYWVMTKDDLKTLMDRLPLEHKGWPTHIVGRPIRLADDSDGVCLAYPDNIPAVPDPQALVESLIGHRVRIKLVDGDQLEGTVLGCGPSGFTITSGIGGRMPFRYGEVDAIDDLEETPQ